MSSDKKTNDTIQAIKEVRTDFRLQSCNMLMSMCGDIGDVIQTHTNANVKTKLQMIECRNQLLSQIESIHRSEQKDAETAKKAIRKNKSYRRIRFNETELKMLEEIVELKNDPNNRMFQSENAKKQKLSKKVKKSFISRAGNEQNHKNYKEFVKKKHIEFDQRKSKIIAQYKTLNENSKSQRALPPITPRELENLHEIKDENNIQIKQQSITEKQLLSHSEPETNKSDVSKKRQRRFQFGSALTLKGQMNELKKLKRIKLNDLNHTSKFNSKRKHRSDNVYLPGQL